MEGGVENKLSEERVACENEAVVELLWKMNLSGKESGGSQQMSLIQSVLNCTQQIIQTSGFAVTEAMLGIMLNAHILKDMYVSYLVRYLMTLKSDWIFVVRSHIICYTCCLKRSIHVLLRMDNSFNLA